MEKYLKKFLNRENNNITNIYISCDNNSNNISIP